MRFVIRQTREVEVELPDEVQVWPQSVEGFKALNAAVAEAIELPDSSWLYMKIDVRPLPPAVEDATTREP